MTYVNITLAILVGIALAGLLRHEYLDYKRRKTIERSRTIAYHNEINRRRGRS